MKLLMVGFCLLFTASIQAKPTDNPPTVKQCRSDRDLWVAEASKRSDLNYLTDDILRARQVKLMSCTSVDPRPKLPATMLQEMAMTVVLEHVSDSAKWARYVDLRMLYAEEMEKRLTVRLAQCKQEGAGR